MPLQVKKNASTTATKTEVAEKTKAVVEAEMPLETATPDENIGVKSDTLTFVAALGDPSQDDVTTNKETGEKKVDPTIVGYRFTATEALEVPDCKPGDDLKKNLMSFTSADVEKTRKVKAGETFDLTKFETGLLISRPEYNGRATGGQIPVICSYTNSQKKTSNGSIAKTSSATAIPTVALRAVSGSIKDYAMINVLEFKKVTTEAGTVRKERTINKGFEKWEALCKDAPRAPRTSAGTNKTKARNKGAQAFLQIAKSKKQA